MQNEKMVLFISEAFGILGFLILFLRDKISGILLMCTSMIIMAMYLLSDSIKLNKEKKNGKRS